MSGGAVLTFGGGGRNGGGGMFGGSGPGGKKVGILAGVCSASDVECSEITCMSTERRHLSLCQMFKPPCQLIVNTGQCLIKV